MHITLLFVVLIALRLGAAEANWPEFRGPQGQWHFHLDQPAAPLERGAEREMEDPDPWPSAGRRPSFGASKCG